jgi:arginine N-succinyltransferase
MVIRPVAHNDLDSLYQLAQNTGHGLTTLPADKEALAEKIESSTHAFSAELDQAEDEYYLLVLEDTEKNLIVGTSGIASAVGRKQAFFTYKLTTLMHASPSMDIQTAVQTLNLTNDFTGATEICTLFLSPEYRKNGNGPLLSKSRFLLMADYGHRFSDTVIAEMRGYSNEAGKSPFWEAIGRKFFAMDFITADNLSGTVTNEFINELMPRYPIYVNMLPQEAQDVLGMVHPQTKPAKGMLEREGFRYNGYVDIFDAGPTIQVRRDDINTVRDSLLLEIADIQDIAAFADIDKTMISNTSCKNFRAGYGFYWLNDNGCAVLDSVSADKLHIGIGDSIRVKTK